MGVKSEQRPLLVSFLDSCGGKGSDDEGYDESKLSKSMSFRNKVKTARRAGKGRARSMAMGAASIFNRWPDNLLFCWLSAIAFLAFTVGCIYMLINMGKNASHLNYQEQCLLRSTHASRHDLNTKTNLYLHVIVNSDETFEPSKFKSVLSSTVKHHPNYIINLFVLFNDMLDGEYKRNSRFNNWEIYHKGIGDFKFFDTSSAEMDRTSVAEIEVNGVNDEKNENITIMQSTISHYFKHSPLRSVWQNIPQNIVPTIMRILSVWEHGGISLPWNMFLEKTNVYCENKSTNSKLRNLVAELKKNFAESVAVPRDPAQIKKELLDDMKNEFRGLTVEAGVDFSESSEIKQAFRSLKGNVQNVNKFDFNKGSNKKELFLTKSEETMAANPVTRGRNSLPRSLQVETKSRHSSKTSKDDYDYSYYDGSEEDDDGLPRSYESDSGEISLRPAASVVNDQIRNMVKGKDGYLVRKQRALLSYNSREQIYDQRNYASNSEQMGVDNEMEKYEDKKVKNIKPSKNDFDNRYEEVRKENKPKIIKDPYKELIQDDRKYGSLEKIRGSLQHDRVFPKPALNFQSSSDDNYLESDDYESDSSEDSESDEESYGDNYGGVASASKKSPSNYMSISSDESVSETRSIEKLRRLFAPMSDYGTPQVKKIADTKDYKQNKVFETMNIFTYPNKQIVSFDNAGFYFSVRKPCHAFLAQLINLLRQRVNFTSPTEFISSGVKEFCENRPLAKCHGIAMI